MISKSELIEKYKKHIMKTVVEPTIITEGNENFLKDIDGNMFLDLTTGYSVMALGYGNPLIIKSIQDQLTKLEHCCHYLFYSMQAANFAEKISEISPGKLTKSFLCNSGTEAVEGAIRLARKSTGKYELFALHRGHHGRSMGAASITGNFKEKKGMGPYLSGVHFLPPPYCYRCDLGKTYPDCDFACARFMESSIKYASSDEVACLVIEPIMMDVVIVPPEGYLQEIKGICDDYDILLVTDEVQSGLGRSGKWFAVEHWGVEPDIMILGKALGGGLPLGAYIASDEVADSFEYMDFASSCGGNPLACAAGLQMIDIIQDGVLDSVSIMGEYFMDRLGEIKEHHRLIGDVRGKGLFIGLELIKDNKSRMPAVKEAESLKNLLKGNGVLILRNESTFRIIPPLTITREQIDHVVELIDENLSKIEK